MNNEFRSQFSFTPQTMTRRAPCRIALLRSKWERVSQCVIVAAMLLAMNCPGASADASKPPEAASQKDQKYLPGYILIGPNYSTNTYLIDREGRTVRVWRTDYTPALSTYLLPNGHLLRSGALPSGQQPMPGLIPGAGGRIQELTWEGEVVWDYRYASAQRLPNHDILKLPNGNVLLIVREVKTQAEAAAAGRRATGEFPPDFLMEVKPTGTNSGDIVWEWHVWDHLIQDVDTSKANYGDVAAHPELVDINLAGNSGQTSFGGGQGTGMGRGMGGGMGGMGFGMGGGAMGGGMGFGGGMGGMSDWTHMNSLAYNAELDQVMMTCYGMSEIWIVDHSTTTAEAASHKGGHYGKGGDLLYRWGNPASYHAGSASDQTLFCPHNAHWIPRGLPGEGHILIFNNGVRRPDGNYSSVDEFVPPVDKDGRYTLKPGVYEPKAPIWSFTAPRKTDMYSSSISGAQRLSNGNTLICSGETGLIFEVTPQKEVVWKFTNPDPGNGGPFGAGMGGFGRGGMGAGGMGFGGMGPGGMGPGGRGGFPGAAPGTPAANALAESGSLTNIWAGGTMSPTGNAVFRAPFFPADFPAFQGKDMTPGKTVKEIVGERR
jgi:hypothetical protein